MHRNFANACIFVLMTNRRNRRLPCLAGYPQLGKPCSCPLWRYLEPQGYCQHSCRQDLNKEMAKCVPTRYRFYPLVTSDTWVPGFLAIPIRILWTYKSTASSTWGPTRGTTTVTDFKDRHRFRRLLCLALQISCERRCLRSHDLMESMFDTRSALENKKPCRRRTGNNKRK